MASPLTLKLQHIFGLKGDVADNIHYIDEHHVLYPSGYNIVSYDVSSERKTQRFVPLSGPASQDLINGTGDVSAMAISPNTMKSKGGKVLAVAERGDTSRAQGKFILSPYDDDVMVVCD